jgi:plasmid stability protein
MPLLQVRDVPEDLYETLSKVAEAENRSIAQETIVLLRKALNFQQERVSRRKRVLEEIKEMNFKNTDKFPNPADLIREERDK